MTNSAVHNTVNSRYGVLTVFANDIGAVTQSLLTYGEWAQNELSFLQRFVTSGSTVLDVGAYIGTHTLAFARFVAPKGRVIAVEAQPDTFEVLKKNIAANVATDIVAGCQGIVQLENAIASSDIGQIAIPTIDPAHQSSFGSASLLHTFNHALDVPLENSGGECARAYVRCISIDSLELPDCALIKIDVEGVEDMVLRGATRTLERCSPVVYCECNTLAAGLKSVTVLENAGYKVFAHVVNAFNSDNFFHVQDNIFGNAREVALVGVPAVRASQIRKVPLRSFELLLEIEDADDLALALLNKPQYPSEVLRIGRAARTGGIEVLNQCDATKLELGRLQNETATLQRLRAEERHVLEQRIQMIHQEHSALASEKDGQIAQLHALLRQRDTDIERFRAESDERDRTITELQTLVNQRNANIEQLVNQRAAKENELVRINTLIVNLCASKSWRITKPLRWVSERLQQLRSPK